MVLCLWVPDGVFERGEPDGHQYPGGDHVGWVVHLEIDAGEADRGD